MTVLKRQYRQDVGWIFQREIPKHDAVDSPPPVRQSATIADVSRFAGKETASAAGSLAVLAVNRNNTLDVRNAAARALLGLVSPGVAERASAEWRGISREVEVLARGASDLDLVRRYLPTSPGTLR